MTTTFDHNKVAELAARIQNCEVQMAGVKQQREKLEAAAAQIEGELAQLKAEFTQAVESKIVKGEAKAAGIK